MYKRIFSSAQTSSGWHVMWKGHHLAFAWRQQTAQQLASCHDTSRIHLTQDPPLQPHSRPTTWMFHWYGIQSSGFLVCKNTIGYIWLLRILIDQHTSTCCRVHFGRKRESSVSSDDLRWTDIWLVLRILDLLSWWRDHQVQKWFKDMACNLAMRHTDDPKVKTYNYSTSHKKWSQHSNLQAVYIILDIIVNIYFKTVRMNTASPPSAILNQFCF